MMDNLIQDKFFNQIPGHLYWYSKEGIMWGCNQEHAESFGFKSPQQMVGMDIYHWLAKTYKDTEYSDSLRKSNELVFRGKTLLYEETFNVHGKQKTFISRKLPLKNDQGEIIGLIGNSLDITEQKALEQTLSTEKKTKDMYLKNILTADLPVTFYWMDREGYILCCNEFQAKIFGLKSAAEFLGKRGVYYLGEINGWTKAACDAVRANDFEVMETGKTLAREEYFVIDGIEHTLLSHKGPLLDDENNTIGIFGFSVDITDRKLAEQLKLEKAEAEQREETMHLLAASIAHEMRTPLAAIDTGAASIAKYLPELMEGYKKAKEQGLDVPYITPSNLRLLDETVGNIRHEAREAFSVVDMLVFKSGLSGIETKNFKTCSIKECMEVALERYPFDEHERKLMHWKEDDFEFFGDITLVTHILFNLIKNALYYIAVASKGEITIWVEKNKHHNKLHFKDTGKGIEPNVLPRIFEAFYTTSSVGTGVGLAFSRLALQKMGATIECLSEEGKYTEFILTFPILTPAKK